jgi:hypothetical protein
MKITTYLWCKLFHLVLWCKLFSAEVPTDCSSYHIDPRVLEPNPPTPNPESAIGKAFASLKGKLQAVLVPPPSGSGPSCYEWKCQSKKRKGEICRWCLPSIFVGGIAKCGTTALCDKLVTHPDVRFYNKKETDIFTKMSFRYNIIIIV